ncbi:hypothetical protein IJ103_02115 [Candidatus Saccharibacteria bacterium]|nr:hypothetical protein [Candidatus Saccharibacteria bacterium]
MKNMKSFLTAGAVAAGLGASVFFAAPVAHAIDWSAIVSTEATSSEDVSFDEDEAKQLLLDSAVDYLVNTSTTDVTFDTWSLYVNGTDYDSLAEAMGVEGNVELWMMGDDYAGDLESHFFEDTEQIVTSLTSVISGSEIADVFGVDVTLEVDGTQLGFLTKTVEPLAFTANIPTDLPALTEGGTRDFYLVTIHDGTPKEVAAEFDLATNKVTFETDEFSIFAIVYKDTLPTTEEPGEDGDEEPTETPAETPAETSTETPTTPTTPSSTSGDKAKAMEEMSKGMEEIIAKASSTGTATKKKTTTTKKVKAPNTSVADGAMATSGATVLSMATLAGAAIFLKKRA